MYIRSASPSTVLWAFHTIQPSSFSCFHYYTQLCIIYVKKFCLHLCRICAPINREIKLLKSQIWCVLVLLWLANMLGSWHSVAVLFVVSVACVEPSVLWHCWLGIRKSILPVKNWVGCWHGYLSGVRFKWFAYGPADAIATPSSLASLKSRMALPLWCWLWYV